MAKFILIILLLLILFFIYLLIRALRFLPPTAEPREDDGLAVDSERAVNHLREMIRCKTISQPELRSEAEFERFRALLPEFYPLLFSRGSVERVEKTGVLICLPGKKHDAPAVLMGHYDVVPADEKNWEKPPFDAVLEDGVLWGRGTLDMKNQLCCMLEAAETLLERGFIPEEDIYFALSGEEEMMGPTAPAIRDLFKSRQIKPAFVLDEGGDIVDGFFPGADFPCAMIGIGEKGSANLHFVARGKGGHSSVPSKENPLVTLCSAMTRVSRYHFKQHPGQGLDAMVETMGRYCSLSTRLLLANRKMLKPLYFRWLKKQGGMLEAASRTTFALTMAKGASAGNVIPPEAEMFANLRLLAGDTHGDVVKKMQTLVGPDIEVVPDRFAEACPESRMTQGYDRIKSAIEATWPEAVVSPYLMVACTDSRHWREICDNVYRFSGKQVTGEEKATVHGNNERIRIENTENAVKFFICLLRQC